MYVMKLHAAICKANCLRILHNSTGPSMVRIMYYEAKRYYQSVSRANGAYVCVDSVRDQFRAHFFKTFLLEGEIISFRELEKHTAGSE